MPDLIVDANVATAALTIKGMTATNDLLKVTKRLLDIEAHPVLSLGLIGILIISVAYVVVGLTMVVA